MKRDNSSQKEDDFDTDQLVRDAVRICGRNMGRIREALKLGMKEIEMREHSISFEQAVAMSLEAKANRKARTVSEIKQVTSRMMKKKRLLKKMPLRSFTSDFCRRVIFDCFSTPRQQLKARVILGGVFSVGQKKGYCAFNPVSCVDVPRLGEETKKSA